MTSSPATEAAASLFADLVAHGVRDVVLSPGSRSQALALAAATFARSDAAGDGRCSVTEKTTADAVLRARLLSEQVPVLLALGLPETTGVIVEGVAP